MHTKSHSIPSPTTVAVSNLPSRILRQWFGLAVNAVISTCRTQFINHADYKIIDSAAVTKIHSPHHAVAVQRQIRDRKQQAVEDIADIQACHLEQ